MLQRLMIVFISLAAGACSNSAKMDKPVIGKSINLLDSLLKSRTDLFGHILQNNDSYRVQIIYTQVNRDAGNHPTFTDYTFNVDSNVYFYPASTVKMPVAFLALQRLNELNVKGVDRTTSMVTDSNYTGQQTVFTDPRSVDSRPTIEQYIKEIFLVSDNDAFNRLYEFLSQEYINHQLHKKGYNSAEILHRLNISLTEEENRHTNAVTFYDTSGYMLYHQPAKYNHTQYNQRNTFLGKGYYKNGELIKQPFDFSKKNLISLFDLHRELRSVIFPDAVPAGQRFNLKDDDYRFLYRYMSMLPGESKYPTFDSANYWDAYSKFILFGSQKGSLPPNIRVFNKIGGAYGFLTDVAYVVDFDTKTEFMLSATIFCNKKGIFNSDDYEYNQVGYPFLKNLGQVIYQYELQRKKANLPNLEIFKFIYK